MSKANSKMVLIPIDRYESLTSTNVSQISKHTKTEDCMDHLSEENILEFIPFHFQNKAKLIFRHMKTHDIKWDNCGRLILDNDCVVNANIIEMLNDVVSTNNTKIESNSSKQFYKLLILTNFPVSLLNLRDGDNTESGGEKVIGKSLL